MMEKDAEYWDIYDIDGHFLEKKVQRGSVLKHGEYHLYVDIWVMISSGKVLLTFRAPDKDTAPLKWENTGGSVISGEDPLSGSVRELFEETGIQAAKSEMIFLARHTYGDTISYIYLFLCHRKSIPITLLPTETVDYRWVELSDVEEAIAHQKMVPEISQKYRLVSEKLKEYSQQMRKEQ